MESRRWRPPYFVLEENIKSNWLETFEWNIENPNCTCTEKILNSIFYQSVIFYIY